MVDVTSATYVFTLELMVLVNRIALLTVS